jgi:PAS domain S-box-containing protein
LLEETAAELIEDAPCGFLSTQPDGTIVAANRTFLTWMGFRADDLLGRVRFYDLLPPGAKIYYETHYAPLLQMQGGVRELALELVRADGVRLPVLVNASVKADDAGRPAVVRITVFDASERRRYERELLRARAEAEERAAAATALAHVGDGVLLADDDGRVRILNPAAERIFGVTADEARGLPCSSLAPDWNAVVPRIPLGAGAPSIVVPLTLHGGTRWLAVAGESAPGGSVYTLRDVTDERRLEEIRDDIVAVASHELRTPLAGVYGAAQTLQSLGDRLGETERAQMVAMIAEQSARLVQIVEDMLLTQRLDAGNVELERAVFDVGDVVERAAAATSDRHALREIEVDTPPGIRAEGDARLFEQVLVNLLDNAFKYGAPTGPVRVAVERARAHARVTVADEGPGVPAAEWDRIFEKFFRLDPSQQSGGGGTGLGLYIARELVVRMRGRLGLLPSDHGATFFVELPLEPSRTGR